MNPLKKLLKKAKFYINEPYLDKKSNVRFIHQQPSHRNIGDDLCSPKHYFTFSTTQNQKMNVFGGGVEDKFYLTFIERLGLDTERSILWGVGQSLKKCDTPKFIQSLPFRYWGLRDIDSTLEEHFLPCVSCLHPMLDAPIKQRKKLIFINFDPQITTSSVKNTLSEKYANTDILYNNCSDEAFQTALENTEHIITNSFHGAYWGLLSGRKVSLIGYSTKFSSLYKMFQLDITKIIKVDRGCEVSLLEALDYAMQENNIQELDHSKNYLQKFRTLNLNFANKLVEGGLFVNIELRK